jgi:Ion channel
LSDSFILKAFDAVTHAWVSRLSLIAIPVLRRGTRPEPALQRNRDIFILFMLGLSTAMVVAFHINGSGLDRWRQAIAALGLYRAVDLFISLGRTGVFLSFRGDVKLKEEPIWRVQRALLGVMVNYVELIMWFTVIYRQLSLTSPCEFSEHIVRVDQAFNLSFSTMTTIGYGKYAPDGIVSNLLAFFQVLIGVILLVLVVGSVLALITGGPHSATATTPPSPVAVVPAGWRAWLLPLASFAMVWCLLFWFFGLRFCPT